MESTYPARMTMTPEKIQTLFNYDPETGVLIRSRDYGRGIKGQTFQTTRVMIDGISYMVTHIIWVCHYGNWPPDGYWIDHEDRIKAHNWISNLRLATPTQNQYNKSGSGTYAKGVTWRDRKSKPWQAKIRVDGERLHLGSFATEAEAALAYQEACIKYHGEFACPI